MLVNVICQANILTGFNERKERKKYIWGNMKKELINENIKLGKKGKFDRI